MGCIQCGNSRYYLSRVYILLFVCRCFSVIVCVLLFVCCYLCVFICYFVLLFLVSCLLFVIFVVVVVDLVFFHSYHIRLYAHGNRSLHTYMQHVYSRHRLSVVYHLFFYRFAICACMLAAFVTTTLMYSLHAHDTACHLSISFFVKNQHMCLHNHGIRHHHTYMQRVWSQHRLSLVYNCFPKPPYVPACSWHSTTATLICSMYDHGTVCPFFYLSSSHNLLIYHNHSHHDIYIYIYIYHHPYSIR